MALSILLWILYSVIGYCILCWIAGLVLYFLGKLDSSNGGDSELYVLVAPLMPIVFIMYWFDNLVYKFSDRNRQNLFQWIVKNLCAKGIEARINFGFQVVAKVTPEQVKDYQDVYAQAIVKFKKLTPEQICGRAEPREPLDHNWADRIGITEYFDREFFMVCNDCGSSVSLGIRWGNEDSHENFFWRLVAEQERVINLPLKDGGTKVVHGYLCSNCGEKAGVVYEDRDDLYD